jgi:hypothetical protein
MVLLASAFFASLAGGAFADVPSSIQLVGNFAGVTCDPGDPANNMESLGNHLWRILKFVNQPGTPDTIYFKFTQNGTYFPKHWGWSYDWGWGKADFSYSPPSIVTALPDSGYYYFHFNDSDYTYWLDRPTGSIHGSVTDGHGGVIPETHVTLYDSGYNLIGMCCLSSDSSYAFDALGPAQYEISVHTPGYRDTTITGITLGDNETKNLTIHVTQKVGVLIASVDCQRADGGVKLSWCTMDFGGYARFDVYRGFAPQLSTMEKRNEAPVNSSRLYEFFDRCEDPTKDLYYYLVELAGDNPTHYGPIYVKGVSAGAAALGQNYPNPFNPSTTIPYTIGATGAGRIATISFYNVAGRLMDRYDLGAKQAGNYTFLWNPSLSGRGDFPSGVYYCRLQIDKETYTRKVILLR